MPQLTELGPLLWALLVLPVLAVFAVSLVDRPRGLRLASLGLRLLAIVLVALALARPTVPRTADRLHVAFLVDLSASVDLGAAEAALDRVDAAVAELAPGDTWSLAAVGRDLRPADTTDELRSLIAEWREAAGAEGFRAASDLAAALRATRLGLPADAAGRVVLMTDARPVPADPGAASAGAAGPAVATADAATATATSPDADLARALAELAGGPGSVEVRLDPVAPFDEPEAAIVRLQASPSDAHEGEVVRLTARVLVNRPMPVEVRIVHRGVVAQRQTVEPVPGEATDVDFDVPMITPGRTRWTAELAAPEDFFAVNNALDATVQVSGRPRVLVLHREPRTMRDFERAMDRQDVLVETRGPRGAPRTMQELLAFDAVVLADVAATDLEPFQLRLLRDYVADFGGGLAMTGSENSFGLGGYYRSPVEEVLPLVSRYEQEQERPSLAMALVIDKSGSMGGLPMALARQAAKATVELLTPRDSIGVVGFDGGAFVAVDMQTASDVEGVKAQIDRLQAGGGTFMYAGMVEGTRMLEGVPARLKHMIILGDGQTQPADHDGLVRDLADAGVTVSTVALGPGADRGLLARLAELGRGRFYETNDPASVPQIFTRETMQATRSAIKEDLVAGVQVGDHPLLAGFRTASLPFSLGYVMTQARPTARVLLATDTGDPLLAVNTFGLGTGMCFTSDLTPRWGAEWLAWPGFGRFWGQAMRALVRRPNTSEVTVAGGVAGDTWTLDVARPASAVLAAAAGDGGTAVLARPEPWRAELIDDAGRRVPARVEPVGLGRARVEAELGSGRRSTIRLVDPVTGDLRILHHVRPYPREYDLAARPSAALSDLPAFDPAAIRADVPRVDARRDLVPWLLLAAVVAFIAGILLRRI